MMDKETYKKELVRMWDSLRAINKGEITCISVKCKECPFNKSERGCNGGGFINIFEKIEIVEKWSKDHPKPRYKISQMEYDVLRIAINYSAKDTIFDDFYMLTDLLEKGYFKGATLATNVRDYFDNCEIDSKLGGNENVKR